MKSEKILLALFCFSMLLAYVSVIVASSTGVKWWLLGTIPLVVVMVVLIVYCCW